MSFTINTDFAQRFIDRLYDFNGNTVYYYGQTGTIQRVLNFIYNPIQGRTVWSGMASILGEDVQEQLRSVRWYPIDFSKYFHLYETGDNFFIGMKSIPDLMNNHGIGRGVYTKGSTDDSDFLFNLGDYYIDYFQGEDNFLSYEPYTNLLLYLPFYGFYELECKRVMGKTLELYGFIDFTQGNFVYYILANGEFIDSVNAHIAVDLPVYGNNLKERLDNVAKNVLATAHDLTNQKAISVAPLVYKLSAYDVRHPQLGKGTSTAIQNYYNPLKPTLLRYNPIIKYNINDTKYNHLYGVPTRKIGKIKEFGGFTKIDKLHSTSFLGVTQKEINEIETLLKQGVRAGNSQATLSITYNAPHINWSAIWDSIQYGLPFSNTFSVVSGYQVDNVQVLMGGNDITSTAVSGNQISIPSVTGNVIINITTSKIPVYHTITYTNLVGATLTNLAVQVEEGTNYLNTLIPDYNLGYYKGNFTPTITMDEVPLSNVYNNGNIVINNVQGDIVISGTLPQSTNLNADSWTPKYASISLYDGDEPILNLTGEMYKDSTQCEFTDLTIDTSEDVTLNNSFVYGTANISGVGSNLLTGLNTQLTISYESGQTYVELGRLTSLHFTTNSAWTNYAKLLEWLDNNFDKVV